MSSEKDDPETASPIKGLVGRCPSSTLLLSASAASRGSCENGHRKITTVGSSELLLPLEEHNDRQCYLLAREDGAGA